MANISNPLIVQLIKKSKMSLACFLLVYAAIWELTTAADLSVLIARKEFLSSKIAAHVAQIEKDGGKIAVSTNPMEDMDMEGVIKRHSLPRSTHKKIEALATRKPALTADLFVTNLGPKYSLARVANCGASRKDNIAYNVGHMELEYVSGYCVTYPSNFFDESISPIKLYSYAQVLREDNFVLTESLGQVTNPEVLISEYVWTSPDCSGPATPLGSYKGSTMAPYLSDGNWADAFSCSPYQYQLDSDLENFALNIYTPSYDPSFWYPFELIVANYYYGTNSATACTTATPFVRDVRPLGVCSGANSTRYNETWPFNNDNARVWHNATTYIRAWFASKNGTCTGQITYSKMTVVSDIGKCNPSSDDIPDSYMTLTLISPARSGPSSSESALDSGVVSASVIAGIFGTAFFALLGYVLMTHKSGSQAVSTNEIVIFEKEEA